MNPIEYIVSEYGIDTGIICGLYDQEGILIKSIVNGDEDISFYVNIYNAYQYDDTFALFLMNNGIVQSSYFDNTRKYVHYFNLESRQSKEINITYKLHENEVSSDELYVIIVYNLSKQHIRYPYTSIACSVELNINGDNDNLNLIIHEHNEGIADDHYDGNFPIVEFTHNPSDKDKSEGILDIRSPSGQFMITGLIGSEVIKFDDAGYYCWKSRYPVKFLQMFHITNTDDSLIIMLTDMNKGKEPVCILKGNINLYQN
ncbi:MAG: hypothetical protein PHG06_17680 [Parabacteroides sp.]|nr:hypothetical protein [Parabacteroides sp.]